MRGLLRPVLASVGIGAALVSGCGARPAPWPTAPAAIAQGPLVLVTFESLRADFVGGLGGVAGNTPNLDRLIPQARASGGWAGRAIAPSSWVNPVLASLLTGLSSWQHGLLHAGRNQLGPDPPTLAERFAEAGWHSQAFASGRRLGPKTGLGRGFSATAPIRSKGRRLTLDPLRAIAPGRQLIWIHLSSPGSPFENRRADAPPDERLRADYGQYVAWLDQELGRVLTALQASGRWEESLVAVVACIGQDLDDPGPRGVGEHLERSAIEVPLVIKLPAGSRRTLAVPEDARVGTVRLYATLLEAAGLMPAPAAAPSLFSPEVPPVLSELYAAGSANQFSLVAGQRQLIRRVPLSAAATGPQQFPVTLPLSGHDDAESHLRQWPTTGGTIPLEDPAALVELGAELEAAWLTFIERERAPNAERWAIRTR